MCCLVEYRKIFGKVPYSDRSPKRVNDMRMSLLKGMNMGIHSGSIDATIMAYSCEAMILHIMIKNGVFF